MLNVNAKSNIIVLGGAFSTGKSTMIEQIRHDFGDKYNYIMDGGREMLELYAGGRTPDELDECELEMVQRAIMAHYINAEHAAMKDPRTTIADGSLVEVAAYSQFILQPRDFQRLDAELRYRSYKNVYTYIKFPTTIPIEYDGVRHTDYEHRELIDKRIERVLAKNDFAVVRLVSDNMVERYAQILTTLAFHDTY